MQCFECRDFDRRWDEFVLANSQGTFFHLLKWRDLIERNFGYEPFYLYAEQGKEIFGVLPLFLVKSLLFGKSLVALPLAVYGGIVSRTEEAERLLFQAAKDLARKFHVRHLEIRGNPYRNDTGLFMSDDEKVSFEKRDLYVTFIREIDAQEENNLCRIPRKQRRMIRQGQKHGLRSLIDSDRLHYFYHIYAESVRNLGTPVYSYGYFKDLKETFGDQCQILLVEYQGKMIAGVLTFFYKDQILPYYAGALRDYFHLAPNDFMYWELMSYGATKGYRVFDFGRSKKGTGSFDFKRHWGFEPLPLPYLYYRVSGEKIPDTSALNPRLQWAVKLWRSLPLRLTMAVGPRIVRHVIP